MKKRIIALLAILVLLVGMFAVAEAGKPTAKLTAYPKTITAGTTAQFKFKLDSGSYKKAGEAFRAKLVVKVTKGSKNYGNASWVWTGEQAYALRLKIDKKAPTGKYKLTYSTFCRKNASAAWKKGATSNKKVTFKVKK